MTPQISVLIPVYNAEKYLPQCLRSLAEQTYTDFEIIAVDDGSTDGSLKILQSFAVLDKRLRIIHQKNAGVAAARNRLLKEACGKYLAFVDADDWVKKEYLYKLYAAADRSGAEITRCFFEQYNLKTRQQEIVPRHFRQPVSDSFLGRLAAGQKDCVVWAKLFRREFIEREKIRFLTGQAAEDLGFCAVAFALCGKVETVEEKLYVYCKGIEGCVTSDSVWQDTGSLYNSLYICDELVRRGRMSPAVMDNLLGHILWALSRLRKFPPAQRKEAENLLKKGVAYLRRAKKSASWRGRWRMNLFFVLAGKPGSKWFYFWTKLFRH